MNLGVLLLYCQEGRITSITRDWADRAVGRCAQYISEQSGGRETLTYKVFDWIKLPQTAAEWSALGFGAYSALKPYLEGVVGESLDPYTHILIGIDHPQSNGGSTPGAVTHLAAKHFMPSLIAHELGHRYGADDAFSETADGPVRYQNRFCVMGGGSSLSTFADSVLADRDAPMINRSGPNMSAPTLLTIGWLNENDHEIAVGLTNQSLTRTGGTTLELSALAGAPRDAWTRPPLLIRHEDLLIEYRIRALWDQGLPDPGAGAGGWVVAHRSVLDAPKALYVNSMPARPGASMVLGDDNPANIFNIGPLKLSVLSYNAAAQMVRLHFSRRRARTQLSSAIYGGVAVDGGGYVWTPGRGFGRVPPRSPLMKILEQVLTLQSLQELMAIASRDEVSDLSREAVEALHTLGESVAEIPTAPVLSPLSQALESISELENISERLGMSFDNREQLGEYLDAARRQLAELKRIIAATVEEENQR